MVQSKVVPFAELLVTEIRDCVVSGERPSIPQHMPEELVRIMTQCWSNEPNDRPEFDEVLADLQEALKSGVCEHVASNLEMLEMDMGGDALDSLGALMGGHK